MDLISTETKSTYLHHTSLIFCIFVNLQLLEKQYFPDLILPDKEAMERLNILMSEYRPVLNGERFLTDAELSECLKLSRSISMNGIMHIGNATNKKSGHLHLII